MCSVKPPKAAASAEHSVQVILVDQIVRSELPYKDDENEGGYRIAGAHPFINRAKRKEDNSAYFSDLWREILLLSMHLGKMSLSPEIRTPARQ